jgi:t-SNARE complex subunit (syntaxin)
MDGGSLLQQEAPAPVVAVAAVAAPGEHHGPGGSGGAPGDLLGGDYVAEPASRPLLDAHRQEQQLVDGRLRQNEDEILRRESDARRIETDVADIAEIMQDLAVVASSHTELIDNIETNVENTVEKTEGANGQLIQAEKYQQGNRKLMCCLFQLLVIVVAGLVLLLIFRKPK